MCVGFVTKRHDTGECGVVTSGLAINISTTDLPYEDNANYIV